MKLKQLGSIRNIILGFLSIMLCFALMLAFNSVDAAFVTSDRTIQTRADGSNWVSDADANGVDSSVPVEATLVDVTNNTELQAAMGSLVNNRTIRLSAGTYSLTNTLVVTNDNVTITGATSNASDVQIVGAGMNNASFGSVEHGIWTNASNLTVQNLTIRDVYRHGLATNDGAMSPHVNNVRFIDTGEQMIKSSSGATWGVGVDNGIVENSYFNYTAGLPQHGGGLNGYTNGIDVIGGDGWIIRNNIFEDHHAQDTDDYIWNPCVLMWRGSSNTLVEGNTFINCDRAIAFGLEDDANGSSHSDGVIKNNMIVMDVGLFSGSRTSGSDAAIIAWDAPNTQILHNTILTQGNLNHAIELRFGTAGSETRNNLADDGINLRDTASHTATNNLSNATAGMFVNPATGDLHLTAAATQTARLAGVLTDFDAADRAVTTDTGADEYSATGGLLAITNLNYEGAFRVNGNTYGSSLAAYNDKFAIAVNPQNGNLLITGNATAGTHDVGEFEIPTLSTSTSIASLAIAANTQPFVDVLNNMPYRTADTDDSNGATIYGMYATANDVILNYALYYDASSPYNDETTFIKRNAANLGASTGDIAGAFKMSCGTNCSGWISPIPAAWQAALGGDHITGWSSGTTRAIIGRLSAGPSAHIFTLSDLTAPPANGSTISTVAAMDFAYPNAMGLPDGGDADTYMDGGNAGMWNKASTTDYCFIVPNTDTYMCLGHEAGYSSGLSYKARNGTSQTDWGDYDATDPLDYRNVYYMFDVNDLVSAKNGSINPYDIEPYAWGTFTPTFGGTPAAGIEQITGATYDANTGRLYVVIDRIDSLQGTGTSHPVIEVYTIGAP